MNAKVFTVGGSRGEIQGRLYEKPRNKFQWSRDRGAWSQHEAGQTQPIRVDGTHSYRIDSRTSAQSATIRTASRGAASGSGNDEIVMRQGDHTSFNVLIAGWWDIPAVVVLEGREGI
jgi:hypothetical protein